MMPRAVLALLAVSVLASGCLQELLGGASRTEWAYDDSQLDAVAALGRSGKGVTVAIVDTGINLRHPSLDHLADGDRANGEVVAFRDFLGDADEVAEAFDEDGHGSHVAGIIAARGGSFDLRGGAPDVLLVIARVCAGQTCNGNSVDDAINWAASQGADVISLSLGGEGGTGLFGIPSSPVEAAVNAAIDDGIVVVASAGNSGPDNGDVEFPANIPGVIAVGAVGRDGRVAAFSSRGDDDGNPCRTLPLPIPGAEAGRCPPHQKPEIVAPGVDILSAWTGKSYATARGTSQATPFVTAAVALMIEGRSLGDRDDVTAVKQALADSARPVPGQESGHDEAAGYGALRARDALRAYGVL